PCTHCLQPPSEYSEDRTSKARTTAVLPRRPVLAVLPRSPVFRHCHSFSPSVQLQPPLTAQCTRHSSHRVRGRSTFCPCFVAPPPSQEEAVDLREQVHLLNQNIQDMARQLHESEERIQALHDELSRRPGVLD
ncbi:hypothetical protein PIB30_103460, partial [Stylosanthes scabra]|nr:hypothetical protein [Stylosanthes scabra]